MTCVIEILITYNFLSVLINVMSLKLVNKFEDNNNIITMLQQKGQILILSFLITTNITSSYNKKDNIAT